jgi:hypothetical protein
MATDWLEIRVDLIEGRAAECDPAPGRIIIVGPSHTFADLAASIDIAFARWDPAHLHVFALPDGRDLGYPDPDEPTMLDHERFVVAKEVTPGDVFGYVFDLGDEWRHRCEVLPETIDPVEEYGEMPPAPVPIFGWGAIPDQYGRVTFDGDEDEELG